MSDDNLDLYAFGEDMEIEELPDGNALGCFSSSTSASTASCPWTSASTLSSAASASG